MQTRSKIIADSISPAGYRITSFEVTYPRFILAEINTHRMIAKSTASSRAIPVKTQIAKVRHSAFVPYSFGRNQAGMQALSTLSEAEAHCARIAWLTAAASAANHAEVLADTGVHKQLANRVLEPFLYTTTILTATEWDNFFKLRDHPEAQPEFQELARLMRLGYESSSPRQLAAEEWHTPYIEADSPLKLLDQLRVSAARCARVSYRTTDGATSSLDKDLELAKRLLTSGHMSPFDHQGVALPAHAKGKLLSEQRHFVGWIPFRHFVEDQVGLVTRRHF
jgi:thymidylate synthase ThyX